MGLKCEYVREYYNVPAKIGLRVKYNNNYGTIYKDGGNYVSVNFDKHKPGFCQNIHPTDPNLEYLKEVVELRQLTKSQRRYQEYLDADWFDGSFKEWLGIK